MARDKKMQSGQYGEESFESHPQHYCDVIDYRDYHEGHAVPLCVRQVPVPKPFTASDWTVADYLLLNFNRRHCATKVSNAEIESAGGCSDDLDKVLAEVKNQCVGGSVADKVFKNIHKGSPAINILGISEFWVVLLGVEWKNALPGHYDELVKNAEYLENDARRLGHTNFRCRIFKGPAQVAEAVKAFYTGVSSNNDY